MTKTGLHLRTRLRDALRRWLHVDRDAKHLETILTNLRADRQTIREMRHALIVMKGDLLEADKTSEARYDFIAKRVSSLDERLGRHANQLRDHFTQFTQDLNEDHD